MYITRSYQPVKHEIRFGEVFIKPTTTIKILGILVEHKIRFTNHVKNIKERIDKLTAKMKRICGKTWGITPNN